MSSTRSASPASDGGSPEPLTPRSKIRALLAAVDNGDAESKDTDMTKSTPTRKHSPQSRATLQLSQQDESDDESEEEIRPRGRLAARMLGIAAPETRKSVEAETQEPLPTQAEVQNDGDLADVEDDDLPVAPRRLQRKAPRESTPDTTEEPTRSDSPGLFVSPTKTAEEQSDAEYDLPPTKSDRFKALVERKRQERLAREAAEEERQAERRAQQEKLSSEMEQLVSDDGANVSDITDDEGGRKLTQEARPARKASKKAVEEMNRETQRMARSMQLAHEAKTRKKISKNSLFERFNFRPAGMPEPEPKTASSSRPGSPNSDVEMKNAETPPSSPPTADAKESAPTVPAVQTEEAHSDEELPTTDQILSSQPSKLDKGKGKAADEEPKIAKPKRQVRVKFAAPAVNMMALDSDDELEVTRTEKDKIMAIFDQVPEKQVQESHSIKALRALAHVTSPGKERRRKEKGMTANELQFSLHQKARQQAKLERDRRMDMLKAQGVVVQTAEERERQMQEVEDLVAKAREEAEQIMQQERKAAKKEGAEEDDPLAWDDSEDDDYEDRGNDADAEVSAVELSGSEDEEEEDDSDKEEVDGVMFDEAAEDGESEDNAEPEMKDVEEPEVDEDDLPTRNRRSRKQAVVMSDDEDEPQVQATPKPKTQASPTVPSSATPNAPSSVLRSAKKSFIPGLPVEGPAGLGLTQIFAGTMDDSQMQMSPAAGPTQSMMPDFDNFPDSNFSATTDSPVPITQRDETQATTQGVQLNLNQTQVHGLDSLMRDVPATQLSELMEASQDGGFQTQTPLKDRFIEAPHSTVDTVVLGEDAPHDSPLIRRGRLRRKMDMSAPEEIVPTAVEATPEVEATPTAFTAIKEGAEKEKKKKAIDDFNRKKSKAKEMVEDHAEESEDEYQGLGGYDGEDSDDESVASVKEMIDDAAGNDVDEGKLAAFYADRERANDEKQVEQLFKDITNGMLRRKRGADYDLSDEDDGGEARRKMKRRQFAKMQKALFSDERVKKMAENPGNQAFLKTIEDRGDDEMDFLNVVEEVEPSQSQDEPSTQQPMQQPTQIVPDSQPQALASASENKTNPRRTKDGRKPANIGEVRQTLSNLLEDDREGSVVPATEVGSDSEGEDPVHSEKENDAPHPRRTNGVVDRISLKRSNSSNMSTGSSRLAFGAGQAGSSSFKVPALLRKATTNSFMSTSSTTSSSNTAPSSAAGGFGEDAKIKKSAGKRSGVNAFARESERRAKIQQSERRREEKKVKGAVKRVGMVGGLLGKGSFE